MTKLPRKYVPLLATAAVFVVLFGGASLRFEGFCSPFVIADLFSENAFLGITAVGMTLVILSGGIDLSVGSVIGFTTPALAQCAPVSESSTKYSATALNAWIATLVR